MHPGMGLRPWLSPEWAGKGNACSLRMTPDSSAPGSSICMPHMERATDTLVWFLKVKSKPLPLWQGNSTRLDGPELSPPTPPLPPRPQWGCFLSCPQIPATHLARAPTLLPSSAQDPNLCCLGLTASAHSSCDCLGNVLKSLSCGCVFSPACCPLPPCCLALQALGVEGQQPLLLAQECRTTWAHQVELLMLLYLPRCDLTPTKCLSSGRGGLVRG